MVAKLEKVSVDQILKYFIRILAILALPVVLLLSFPFPKEKLHPPPSTVVLSRDGELLRVSLAADEMWRIPIGKDQISSSLKKAVLSYEDRRFYWHIGIDPVGTLRAVFANLRAGKIVQGGSTITMQVARLMDPKPRTLSNKLKEMWRALQLEVRYSKDEVLSFYFNMAPYGGNIVGIGAAARVYFGKKAENLSLGEAALLAAIPNDPNGLRPDLNPQKAKAARDKIIRLMKSIGKISEKESREALSETIPGKFHRFPFEAPHLCADLFQKYPEKPVLHATIDLKIQHLAEKILAGFRAPLSKRGITNAAVVVLKNENHEVLALVGSLDFFDWKNDGQVNGATAPRSPGSTLKPFVYGLAIDRGLISPETILYDVPVDYSGYRPVNYDDAYHGVVTVREALTRSLNVPAVNVDAKLGESGLYFFLKNAGLTTLTEPRSHYGLSIVLGGCGVKLIELTNLYCGLANGGVFQPFRYLSDELKFAPDSLLSSGTSFLLAEMLSEVRRPELPASWEYSMNLPKIAWKTGTSYGHRDAWSIGYNPEFTVGVWVGNFDATGVPELIGVDVAAPILFAIFNALESNRNQKWFEQPETVKRRKVCALSGMIPSPNCPETKEELYIPGVSPAKVCNIHRKIDIDKKTGKRLCSICRQGREFETKIVCQWPAEIASWMERNGFPVDDIPEHFPDCPRILSGGRPVILSPTAQTVYKIRRGVDVAYQKILLEATVSNDTKNIFWLLDGKLVAEVDPKEKIFITPEPGKHRITCLDDLGRSAEVRFVVK